MKVGAKVGILRVKSCAGVREENLWRRRELFLSHIYHSSDVVNMFLMYCSHFSCSSGVRCFSNSRWGQCLVTRDCQRRTTGHRSSINGSESSTLNTGSSQLRVKSVNRKRSQSLRLSEWLQLWYWWVRACWRWQVLQQPTAQQVRSSFRYYLCKTTWVLPHIIIFHVYNIRSTKYATAKLHGTSVWLDDKVQTDIIMLLRAKSRQLCNLYV